MRSPDPSFPDRDSPSAVAEVNPTRCSLPLKSLREYRCCNSGMRCSLTKKESSLGKKVTSSRAQGSKSEHTTRRFRMANTRTLYSDVIGLCRFGNTQGTMPSALRGQTVGSRTGGYALFDQLRGARACAAMKFRTCPTSGSST